MYALVILLHILVCLILILVVLLQSGKAADLAGAFGGGGSQTAFGARGAQNFLSKMTTAAAVTFMCTSLALGIISTRQSRSVVEEMPAAPAAGETGGVTPPGTAPLQAEPGQESGGEVGDEGPSGASAEDEAGPEEGAPVSEPSE